MSEKALAELRRQIDVIDERLLEMLSKRSALVANVGDIKKDDPSQAATPFRPAREARMLRRLRERHRQLAEPKLSLTALVGIWQEIIAGSIQLEAAQTVEAYAPKGVDSDLLTLILRAFGANCHWQARDEFAHIIRLLQEKPQRLAIIPAAMQHGASPPWWKTLTTNNTVKIVAQMPIMREPNSGSFYVAAIAKPEASGEDCQLRMLDEADEIPATYRVVDRWQDNLLVEIDGFADAADNSWPGIYLGAYARPVNPA